MAAQVRQRAELREAAEPAPAAEHKAVLAPAGERKAEPALEDELKADSVAASAASEIAEATRVGVVLRERLVGVVPPAQQALRVEAAPVQVA